jgi:hypothetical protein
MRQDAYGYSSAKLRCSDADFQLPAPEGGLHERLLECEPTRHGALLRFLSAHGTFAIGGSMRRAP